MTKNSHWEILPNIEGGGGWLPKRGGALGQFADLRGGLARKRGGG